MVADKMIGPRTTWYGQNGRPTDKVLRIKSSINKTRSH